MCRSNSAQVGGGKVHADEKPSGYGSLDEKVTEVEHEEAHRAQQTDAVKQPVAIHALSDSGGRCLRQYLLRRYDMRRNIEDVPFV